MTGTTVSLYRFPLPLGWILALAPLLLLFGYGKPDGHQRSWQKAAVLVGLQGFEEQDGTSSSGNVWCGGVEGMQEDQG